MTQSLRLGKLALTLTLSALGCGGRAADDSQPDAPSYREPRSTAMSPPVASPPYQPQSSAAMNPLPSQPPPPRRSLRDDTADLAQATAENVLAANCGQCHGPQLTVAQAQDGINYINDIERLVVAGLILPLNSAASRIIVVMRNGSMPPVESGLPAVTDADIQIVASYIDNPRFWPILVPASIVDAGPQAPSFDAGADGG